MPTPHPQTKSYAWWREPWPWFLMALPMTAVVGGLTTAWIASQDPDTLVSDDYYKEGLAIHQVLERDAKASELGLVAEFTARDGVIDLDLDGRIQDKPAALQLFINHPTQAGQDVTLHLQRDRDGRYRATTPTLPHGKRRLSLEPGDRGWRLTGQWEAPFEGRLRLEAQPR